MKDLKGLKYFITYAIVLIGFFVYSRLTGLLWFNGTETESTRSGTGHGRTGHVYRYHK